MYEADERLGARDAGPGGPFHQKVRGIHPSHQEDLIDEEGLDDDVLKRVMSAGDDPEGRFARAVRDAAKTTQADKEAKKANKRRPAEWMQSYRALYGQTKLNVKLAADMQQLILDVNSADLQQMAILRN